MTNRLWSRAALASVALTVFAVGCDDFERQECTSNWECREHFGVGSTCEDLTGYCAPPAIPDACSGGMHFPPDIFESRAARDTITIGLMVDSNGRHAQRASSLALELANLKGGVTSRLPSGFSAVSCAFDSEYPSSREVADAARFLRDDVGVSAVITGMNTPTFMHALEIFQGGNAAGSQVLVVSANGEFMERNREVADKENIWSVGVSDRTIYYRQGQQLALQQLQPHVESCLTLSPELDPIVCAYDAYDATLTDSVASLRFHSLLTLQYTINTGTVVDEAVRQERLEAGAQSAFDAIGVQSGGGARVVAEVAYREKLLLGCDSGAGDDVGTGCNMDAAVINVLFCEVDEDQIDVDNDCAAPGPRVLVADGVYLHTESANLASRFLRALLINESHVAKIVESLAPGQTAHKQTRFFLPDVASAGALGYYNELSSGLGACNPSVNPTCTGLDPVDPADRFAIIDADRFMGVRQSASPLTPPHVEYATASGIFLGQGGGMISFYAEQAYDATWLAMAAISGVVTAAQARTTEDAVRHLFSTDKLAHTLNIRFSGPTESEVMEASDRVRAEISAGNARGWDAFDYVDPSLDPPIRLTQADLRSERWIELLTVLRVDYDPFGDNDALIAETMIGFKAYLFGGSSGHARFGKLEPDAEDRRLRATYDYSVWSLRSQSRMVAEIGASIDRERCRPGAVADVGVYAPTPEERETQGALPENRFVCPAETAICSVTWDMDAEELVASQVNGWRRVDDNPVLDLVHNFDDLCIPWELMGVNL